MPDLRTLLKGLDALGELGEDDLASLAGAFVVAQYEEGHVFIREGTTGDAAHLILEGHVRVTTQPPEANGFRVNRTIAAGELFGLFALIDKGKRGATCVAEGRVRVATLRSEAFALLTNANAPVAFAFQYMVAKQLVRDALTINQLIREGLQASNMAELRQRVEAYALKV